MERLIGTAASPGIVMGKVLIVEDKELSYQRRKIDDVDKEKEKFAKALALSKEQIATIKEKVEREMGAENAQIFQAHLMVVEDPELISAIEKKIEDEKLNVEAVVDDTVDEFATLFANMENEYMQERASDVRDVGDRILRNLLGVKSLSLAEIDDEVILVAEDLTPSDTAQVDKNKVLGFATQIGGRTSHTAIMARSLEIPAVVGMSNLLEVVEDGMRLILDGVEGKIIIDPSQDEVDNYQKKIEEYNKRKERLAQLKDLPAKTKDNKVVELVANIGTPDDVDAALANGAEGIGLYRSEFLYMDRDTLPTEEEQFKAYQEVAQKMNGPVVIRTLDIGGDKELSYLDLPDEMNPFLGYRAIRICLDKEDIFKTQLRAILRASNYGDIKIMYPMISAVEQLRAANSILEEVKVELKEEGIEFSEDVEVGMMIEIPAAAMIADILAKETDFFSIGTNDLIQYTTATDRMNENISHLYQPFHPALLRLIKRVVEAGHKEGSWVGMCGEMAGDERLTPFLLGVGLDEFSMSAVTIPEVKYRIRNMLVDEAKETVNQVLKLETAEEIEKFLS